MEAALLDQTAHVEDLKVTMHQQLAEHVVAQHETKKMLRCALTFSHLPLSEPLTLLFTRIPPLSLKKDNSGC
jgi:hypothetical protein